MSFNFGPSGLVIVGSRMESPTINPQYPQMGQDAEGVGQGRYVCRDDGKIEMIVMLYRQYKDNNPDNAASNYCEVAHGLLELDECGQNLEGVFQIGFADVTFTAQDGCIVSQLCTKAKLQRQNVSAIAKLF